VFNIGPAELLVLALVALIVLGPERLPGLAKDAARFIRALREMATGARNQLREELGPELADLDLRSLNPRTALQKMLFEDLDDDEKPKSAGGPANVVKPRPAPGPSLQKRIEDAIDREVRFDDDAT